MAPEKGRWRRKHKRAMAAASRRRASNCKSGFSFTMHGLRRSDKRYPRPPQVTRLKNLAQDMRCKSSARSVSSRLPRMRLM